MVVAKSTVNPYDIVQLPAASVRIDLGILRTP